MASSPPARFTGSYIEALAAWSVTLDGRDLTAAMNPRLISLQLSEKRGESSDELVIELHDSDGKLALPREGARLAVSLGWARGSAVRNGLVPKGSFVVDEVSWEGPPDKVSIRARSADFAADYRTRKSRVWKDRSLTQIVSQIAADNDLSARCHPDLAGKTVTVIEQANKSDMQFMRDLGRRYDAIATVKDKCLIFAPVDADTTATGQPIAAITITRASGDRYSYRRAERERAQDGAEAQWHDQDSATRKKSSAGGSKRRRLKKIYASDNDASAAAGAETNRIKRAAASMEISLALGDPSISPGMRATATGFKAEIDGRSWRIASAEHKMDATGGLTTQLTLEAAA